MDIIIRITLSNEVTLTTSEISIITTTIEEISTVVVSKALPTMNAVNANMITNTVSTTSVMALLQAEELPTTIVIASRKTIIASRINQAISLTKKIVLRAAILMQEETIRVTETIDDHINTTSTDFKIEWIEVASMVVKEEVSIIEVAIMCLFRDVVETIGKEAAKEDLATTFTPTASTT